MHGNAAAKCWAHKIVLASMSSVKVAGALLLVTPRVPRGLRTGQQAA